MSPTDPAASETRSDVAGGPWLGFVRMAAAAAALLFAALLGFILVCDPYGRYVRPGRPPTPLMDINQRYMYPQLARSGLFDAAVFGTSTTRLLDPQALGAAIGGRTTNLAINAGTPWEQLQLARLFLRHVPVPRALILGLDRPWCDPDADRPDRRLTFRSFPPWLYTDDLADDLPHLVNLKTLEIAGRVAMNRIARRPARIRADGYEVFTPPEASYDLERARAHFALLPSDGTAPAGADGELPAIAWLAALARDIPAATRVVLVFPPLYAGSQSPPGSPDEAADERCKRLAVAAFRPGSALALDYRIRSPLASTETNFWDALHYRLPIAAQIVRDIRDNLEAPRQADDGRYRLLSP